MRSNIHPVTPIIGGDEAICASCGIAALCIDNCKLGEITGGMAAKILTVKAKIEEMPITYTPEYLRLYNPVICEKLGVDISILETLGYSPAGE